MTGYLKTVFWATDEEIKKTLIEENNKLIVVLSKLNEENKKLIEENIKLNEENMKLNAYNLFWRW
jgi:hypothetical protein